MRGTDLHRGIVAPCRSVINRLGDVVMMLVRGGPGNVLRQE